MSVLRRVIGLAITLVGLAGLFTPYIICKGVVGAKNQDTPIAILTAISGMVLILLGPWLVFGDVPVAIRKFVEAKTGRKV